MTNKLVIGGTEFPEKITVDGRPCARCKCPSDYTVYDHFGKSYKGPFKAETLDGKQIPELDRLDRVQTAEGEKTSFLLFDDMADHNDCSILDSEGRVVAIAQSYVAARQIMCALNQEPTHMKEGVLLGLCDNSGLTHVTKEDRFAFWCIQIDPNMNNETAKGVSPILLRRSYVMPLRWMFLEAPPTSNNPMAALRFRGVGSTKQAIEIIQNKILPTVDPDSKVLKVWNWADMKPVMVKYAYNIVK